MNVQREPGAVVENLREPAQPPMARGIFGSHQACGIALHGLPQAQADTAVQCDVAEALIGRPDLVVSPCRRGQPPLAEEAPLPHVVGVAWQAEPAPGRDEVPGNPGGLQAQDAVLVRQRLLQRPPDRLYAHDRLVLLTGSGLLSSGDPRAYGDAVAVDGLPGREVEEVSVAHIGMDRGRLARADLGPGGHLRNDRRSLLLRLLLQRANRLGTLVR